MTGRRPAYAERYQELHDALAGYEASASTLPGIAEPGARDTFIEQLIDSEQRVAYFLRLQSRPLDWVSADPSSEDFDPLKAAVLHRDTGDYDEAVWLVYLFVHFGHHRRAGWRYARDVYGRLGSGERWTWSEVSTDPTLFRYWLADNMDELERPGPRGFGNHRKYESLNAWEPTGTGEAVESYVAWVLDGHADHAERFARARLLGPEPGFDELFRSMDAVRRFGRIAKFDYLNALKRLALLDVRPPHTYLVGATGPLIGARLLLDEAGFSSTATQAQAALSQLTSSTGIASDVLEDAVCNWQKSPTAYVRFSG